MLKYIDDVELRQTIEKPLNKGELANKCSETILFANQNILKAHSEAQEISVMYEVRTILKYGEIIKMPLELPPECYDLYVSQAKED